MGFPDWQRITQWVGPALLEYQKVTLGAGGSASLVTTEPSKSYANLCVAIEGGVDGAWLLIRSQTGSALLLFLADSSMYIPAGAKVVVVLPMPLGEATVEITNGTAGDTLTAAVFPTNLPTGCYLTSAGPGIVYEWPSAVIAAGGSLAVDLSAFFGEAVALIDNNSAGNFAYEVDTLDSSGATIARVWYELVAAGAVVNSSLWIPVGRSRLTIYNQSGANHATFVAIAGKHRPVAP